MENALPADIPQHRPLERFWVLFFVITPFLAFIIGMAGLWGLGADLTALVIVLILYFPTGFGITVGFHRFFTHSSFKACYEWVKWTLGILGSMAIESNMLRWIGWHMLHHRESDKEGDPHSPYFFGTSFWGVCRGFAHAHVGWMLTKSKNIEPFIRKMRQDPTIAMMDRLFPLWVTLSLIAPVILGIVIRGSYDWMLVDFVWGGLVRIFFVHHVTWCVNSVCHVWGDRPFVTGDQSTNNWLIGFLGLGEGYHNCHHAFPWSAKHGLMPGQIDLSWYVISAMQKLGLVTDVKVPSREQIARRLKPAHV